MFDAVTIMLCPILVVGPFLYAVYILRQLDQAARQRKKFMVKTKFRFMIVDFFSLILLIQMPFNLLRIDSVDATPINLMTFLSVIALTSVWFTTIRTASQAGIVTFKWRALVSMILIPTMYIGCFYISIISMYWLTGQSSPSREAFAWLFVSVIGMVASMWIVRGALDSSSHEKPLQHDSQAPDPFAD